ncbi:hypothetical protein BN8_01110 [Fibrisoma limi BUZ 3]|uniref:Curli production assembly/transport component CsgG n=1 Tax=Fibrisoma limi BUZ 3 TaxID=1185876 RepID=I2GE11_9BACT|nr:CsgG/HfaB family protein [Fibrisoma limi]CCH52136.1 hypothetical protein BN8_01110 [Fibrisoma limi BUZ 3]
MKSIYPSLVLISIWLLLPTLLLAQKNKNESKEPEITIAQVAEKCQALPASKRVTVRVARFDVSKTSADGKFGDELATMLTSALQQTNCFRVLEMQRNASDMTGEMSFAQSGYGSGGPEAGKMLMAQLIVTGEVTEYLVSERSQQVMGFGSSKKSAKVGFTLKILDPQTGEILASKIVRAEGQEAGARTTKIFGIETSTSSQNSAVTDACGIAVIRSAEFLADTKDKIEIPEPMKPETAKKFDPSRCNMLKKGAPKVMILIPEAQTGSASTANAQTRRLTDEEREYQERKETREMITAIFGRKKQTAEPAKPQTNAVYKPVVIEQATAENEIIRKFIEAGFRVIDPKVYEKMRTRSDSLASDPAKLAALGLKMGANIIITGMATSELVNANNGMNAFRGRIELRALTTDDATILASNVLQAGAVDVSETVAAKMALTNVGNKMADYMLEQLCARNIIFAGTGGGAPSAKPASVGASTSNTEITIANTTFAKVNAVAAALQKNPKVKGVQKTFKGTEGTIRIEHTGTTDELIDLLTKNPALKLEVTALEEGSASLTML